MVSHKWRMASKKKQWKKKILKATDITASLFSFLVGPLFLASLFRSFFITFLKWIRLAQMNNLTHVNVSLLHLPHNNNSTINCKLHDVPNFIMFLGSKIKLLCTYDVILNVLFSVISDNCIILPDCLLCFIRTKKNIECEIKQCLK